MMADKSETSSRALTGPRVLTKGIEEYTGTYVDGSGFPAYKNWKPSTSGFSLMHESYFDLSGYARDYLTLVPSGVNLQDGGYYVTTGSSPLTGMFVIDIVSQERLTHDDVETQWLTLYNLSGQPETEQDFEQIVYGKFRWLAPTLNNTYVNGLTPMSQGLFGSSSPTTVQKLWCYRFLIYTTQDATGDAIACNATRFLLGATVIKEDDLPFLMRQKRSYELGTDN